MTRTDDNHLLFIARTLLMQGYDGRRIEAELQQRKVSPQKARGLLKRVYNDLVADAPSPEERQTMIAVRIAQLNHLLFQAYQTQQLAIALKTLQELSRVQGLYADMQVRVQHTDSSTNIAFFSMGPVLEELPQHPVPPLVIDATEPAALSVTPLLSAEEHPGDP